MPNVVFCDGFGHYAVADMSKKGWSAGGAVSILSGQGRSSGFCVRFSSGATTATLTLAPMPTVYVEFGFRQSVFGTVNFMQLQDTGTTHVDLRTATGGELQITRNGTPLAITSGLGLAINTWYHVGLQVTIHDTAGSVELRVNGVNAASASPADTRNGANASVNQVRLNGAGSVTTDICDFVVSTDAFCGDCAVRAVYPQGAGHYSQWTPSAGPGWQCVDEASMNSDTDYVSSDSAGQRNSYDFTALPAGVVRAVQHVTALRKDDAGSRTVKQFARTGGTDHDGSAVTVTDTYLMQRRMMAVNPSTGTDWTAAQVDAAEFGTLLES